MKKALCFNDVLLVPKHWSGGSRSEVDLTTTIAGIKLDVPIISANMASLTESAMAISLGKKGGLGILHRMCSIDEQIQMVRDVKKENVKVGASIGIDKQAIVNAQKLIDAGADLICLDVAFFAQDKAHDVAIDFCNKFTHFPFIVGNIATLIHFNMFQSNSFHRTSNNNLAFKVGVGSSGVCSTRIASGAGLPTLASLLDIKENKNVMRNNDFVADGGHATPGDICKSLTCGAKAVMIGGMLAATSDAPGDIIERDGRLYKQYFGNASSTAKRKAGMKTNNIEGVSVELPYKGTTSEVIDSILEGVRSGATYCGAKNLKEMAQNAEFVEITSSGYKESTPYFKE